ncbi:DUF5682 family protein, partial [Kitasatospora sp. NPDC059571]|uniref:DUF5682 family protein n=1 Tax=Kitasatospora sp. NPDC059571 TaxID=3346871 RepID=UPI0036D03243
MTDTATAAAGPREAVAALAASTAPYLIGVRHHSPALAAVVPALLDAADPQVLCIELPSDFQRWLPHLAAPGTTAPVALAGADGTGRLGFYPFADFSPELTALRWARDRGVEVRCCDLPMADPAWADRTPAAAPAAGQRTPAAGPVFADALTAAGTGRDGDDLWDRSVEVRAPGSSPEAVRRAALAVGWALRRDAAADGGVPAVDLAREAHMRRVVAEAAADGRRVAALVGAFHGPALVAGHDGPADDRPTDDGPSASSAESGTPGAGGEVTTSLVPYTFALLDARSGYPAGIRDPRWQQAVLGAQGDPVRVAEAAATAITELCRELRAAGHTAGTGEAAETLRLAGDLARLRGLPAPGRGELLEAVTTVLGQGEPLGRGRALARALETVLVGTVRGRTAPGTPRSGLGPAVEADLAELRLPGPDRPESKEVRLDPLRSPLDARREVLLQRLHLCGIGYGEPEDVAAAGDATALTTRWRVSWTPSVAARLDLAGVRGVTAELAAAGTLREAARRQEADGGPTCAQLLDGLRAAARCDLPDLVAERLGEAELLLPAAATLPELLAALDLLDALRRGHLPGAGEHGAQRAAELAAALLDAAVRALPGLAGSDDPEDAAALVALATRAGEHRLGLRMDDALGTLARTAAPLVQGAALAARVLLDLDGAAALGTRAAGWVDTPTPPVAPRRTARLLAGLLSAGGPLLECAPTALDPLLERIDRLPDRGFLDRLPALRAGFDVLTPAARGRLLETVTERLGERPDLTLAAAPDLLALWAAADAAAAAALAALGLPGTGSPGPAAGGPAAGPSPVPEAESDAPAAADAGPDRPAPAEPLVPADRLAPADRWRLLLGREPERLPAGARRYARALDELYGAGRGEGAQDFGGGDGGGQEASFPTAREWAEELDALFGADVREEVLGRAADAGRTDVLAELDPASVRARAVRAAAGGPQARGHALTH